MLVCQPPFFTMRISSVRSSQLTLPSPLISNRDSVVSAGFVSFAAGLMTAASGLENLMCAVSVISTMWNFLPQIQT